MYVTTPRDVTFEKTKDNVRQGRTDDPAAETLSQFYKQNKHVLMAISDLSYFGGVRDRLRVESAEDDPRPPNDPRPGGYLQYAKPPTFVHWYGSRNHDIVILWWDKSDKFVSSSDLRRTTASLTDYTESLVQLGRRSAELIGILDPRSYEHLSEPGMTLLSKLLVGLIQANAPSRAYETPNINHNGNDDTIQDNDDTIQTRDHVNAVAIPPN
jgi:hypothetical protein